MHLWNPYLPKKLLGLAPLHFPFDDNKLILRAPDPLIPNLIHQIVNLLIFDPGKLGNKLELDARLSLNFIQQLIDSYPPGKIANFTHIHINSLPKIQKKKKKNLR